MGVVKRASYYLRWLLLLTLAACQTVGYVGKRVGGHTVYVTTVPVSAGECILQQGAHSSIYPIPGDVTLDYTTAPYALTCKVAGYDTVSVFRKEQPIAGLCPYPNAWNAFGVGVVMDEVIVPERVPAPEHPVALPLIKNDVQRIQVESGYYSADMSTYHVVEGASCSLSNDKGKWHVDSHSGQVEVVRSAMPLHVTCCHTQYGCTERAFLANPHFIPTLYTPATRPYARFSTAQFVIYNAQKTTVMPLYPASLYLFYE